MQSFVYLGISISFAKVVEKGINSYRAFIREEVWGKWSWLNRERRNEAESLAVSNACKAKFWPAPIFHKKKKEIFFALDFQQKGP